MYDAINQCYHYDSAYDERVGEFIDTIKLSNGEYDLVLNEIVPSSGAELCIFKGDQFWGEDAAMGANFYALNDYVSLGKIGEHDLIRYDASTDQNERLRKKPENGKMFWRVCSSMPNGSNVEGILKNKIDYQLHLPNYRVEYITPVSYEKEMLLEMDEILLSLIRNK